MGTQGTSHFKPRGPLGSSPLWSDGSRNGQAGEAGPVEQSSAEAKSLKTKGLSGCHPSGQQPRQPGGGPGGQIKDHSHDSLLKETSNGQKQLVKEKALSLLKKERRLLYAPILNLQWGMMSSSM